jgi:hypothetical protein
MKMIPGTKPSESAFPLIEGVYSDAIAARASFNPFQSILHLPGPMSEANKNTLTDFFLPPLLKSAVR